MHKSISLVAAVLWALLFAPLSMPQTVAGVGTATPEARAAAYDAAMKSHDWVTAVAVAREAVDSSATAENLRKLADAQLYSGAAEQALAAYERASAAAEQEKPALGQPDADWKDRLAKIFIGKGNALLKLHRTADAIEFYNRAAEFAANPGKAYFNICAVLYNSGNTKDSPTACRKCLQADPSMANAWFILGSVLFADASISGKGTVALSAEGQQALEKYLELAPDGPHAADAKAMLQMVAR
jgi:tetratricopeptide (TPR) repeat protein